MAESAEEPNATDTKSSVSAANVVDNELALANGLRTTAIWVAGILGAIPVFATIGTLVQNAGDNGFAHDRLAVGLVFAVAGALLGLAASAYVRAPLGTRFDDITDGDVKRIPGGPHQTKAELIASVEIARQAIATLEDFAVGAAVEAKRKRATANRLAEDLKEMRGQTPNASIASIVQAAELHSNAASVAEDAEFFSGAHKADLERWRTQLERRKERLDQAFLLHGVVPTKGRIAAAAFGWTAAVAAVGASLFYLATAPKEKAADSSAAVTPELVQISLSPTGKTELHCDVDTLQGVKIGGTDKAPMLITFPQTDCPARSVTFVAAEPSAWGTVEKVTTVQAPK
jgi:hypothetical protein